MREYSSKISLTQNSRGVYSLDTSVGCTSGTLNNSGGCFGECYAAKSAKLYGYNFKKTVFRSFENSQHRISILKKINKVGLSFIRIGTSGDPSENWEHAISIIKQIQNCGKEIVIITRHWNELTCAQLKYFSQINVTINTSISALDDTETYKRCFYWYNRLKRHCKSVLRVVTCDFNTENRIGFDLKKAQDVLLRNDHVIDNILRVNPRNKLISSGIINAERSMFLGKPTLVSRFNKNTYFNKCSTCHEQCGVNVSGVKLYPDKKIIPKQLKLL